MKAAQGRFPPKAFDSFRSHACFKVIFVLLAHFAVVLLAENLHLGQTSDLAGVGYDVACEVQNLLKKPRGDIEHKADSGGDTLEVPDMGNRSCKLDVTHSFTSYLRACYLNSALVADLALEADSLVLSAVTFPILGRSENALAVKTVSLGLEGSVVDGLGLFTSP